MFKESLTLNAVQRSMAQSVDSAGRRIVLSDLSEGSAFSYQADGLMSGVSLGSITAFFDMAYSYGDNGYLTRRYNPARDWRMNSRDGRGRLLQATTYSWSQTALTETMSYQGNGRISAYTAARADFTDSRSYTY